MKSFVFHLDKDFDIERKNRSDKGQTVFNRKNKQKNVFSGINIYKKNKSHEWQEYPGRIQEKELFAEYEALTVE